MSDFDRESVRKLVTDIVLAPDFRRATFGGTPRGGDTRWVRVVVRPVQLRGERHIQFAYFDQKKNVTKNYAGSEAETALNELLEIGFAGIHLWKGGEEVDLRTTKKGKVSVGRRKVAI